MYRHKRKMRWKICHHCMWWRGVRKRTGGANSVGFSWAAARDSVTKLSFLWGFCATILWRSTNNNKRAKLCQNREIFYIYPAWCPLHHPYSMYSFRYATKQGARRAGGKTAGSDGMWSRPMCGIRWCFVMIRMMWFWNYVHKLPYKRVNFRKQRAMSYV